MFKLASRTGLILLATIAVLLVVVHPWNRETGGAGVPPPIPIIGSGVTPPTTEKPTTSQTNLAVTSSFDLLSRAQIPDAELKTFTTELPVELVGLLRQDISKVSLEPEIGFAISREGGTIAYCFGGPKIYLWDTGTRTTRSIQLPHRYRPNPNRRGIAFGPDGKTLAYIAGRTFCLCTVWDFRSSTHSRSG